MKNKTSPKTFPKLTLNYIRAWGAEWHISEDAMVWIVEAYAKSVDEREVVLLMNKISNAQCTRVKNLPLLESRRPIVWETDSK
jgi:hypothetical protein